jgi:hypothetical protein
MQYASQDLAGMNPRTRIINAPFYRVLPIFEEYGVCRGIFGVFSWHPLHSLKFPAQNISRRSQNLNSPLLE